MTAVLFKTLSILGRYLIGDPSMRALDWTIAYVTFKPSLNKRIIPTLILGLCVYNGMHHMSVNMACSCCTQPELKFLQSDIIVVHKS